jgi:hypothetical protein
MGKVKGRAPFKSKGLPVQGHRGWSRSTMRTGTQRGYGSRMCKMWDAERKNS